MLSTHDDLALKRKTRKIIEGREQTHETIYLLHVKEKY